MAGIDLYLQNLRDCTRYQAAGQGWVCSSPPENKVRPTNYESEFSTSPVSTSERCSDYLKYISVSFYIKLTFLVAGKLFILLIFSWRYFGYKDNGNFDWWFFRKYLMFDNVKSIKVWDNLSEGDKRPGVQIIRKERGWSYQSGAWPMVGLAFWCNIEG